MTATAPDALLLRAQHPGVVPLAGTASGPRLADVDLTVEEVAAVFAVLATTLADLIDVGITLGPVDAASVVVGHDGRPVIVDLSRLAHLGAVSHTETDDVRNLGRLLLSTLRRSRSDLGTPTAPRPWWRRRPRSLMDVIGRWATAAERGTTTLRQLADGLVHPEARLPCPLVASPAATTPERPAANSAAEDELPGGSALGDEVGNPEPADAVLGNALPVDAAPAGAAPRSALLAARSSERAVPAHRYPTAIWQRPAVALLAVGGVTLLAFGISSWRGPSRPRLATAVRPGAGTRSGTTGTTGTAGSSGTGGTTGTSLCMAVSASGSCVTPATYAGGVLTSAAGRFAVGRPDDVVAVGRWSCVPVATLALLRPDRGEIWIFSGWPGPGAAPLTGRLAARIPQVRQLGTRRLGACDALVATRADTTSVVIDTAAFR